MAFGAKLVGQTFGASTTRPPKFNLLRFEDDLSQAHLRLSRTYIKQFKQLDWAACIAKYDRPHTLFYCDPPYWGTEGYGADFGLDKYAKLVAAQAENGWVDCAKTIAKSCQNARCPRTGGRGENPRVSHASHTPECDNQKKTA